MPEKRGGSLPSPPRSRGMSGADFSPAGCDVHAVASFVWEQEGGLWGRFREPHWRPPTGVWESSVRCVSEPGFFIRCCLASACPSSSVRGSHRRLRAIRQEGEHGRQGAGVQPARSLRVSGDALGGTGPQSGAVLRTPPPAAFVISPSRNSCWVRVLSLDSVRGSGSGDQSSGGGEAGPVSCTLGGVWQAVRPSRKQRRARLCCGWFPPGNLSRNLWNSSACPGAQQEPSFP